jgi:hypothetical protein
MGALLIAAAILIVLKARSGWGWVGFLASVTMGAITIADYRDIGSRPSPLLEQMNAVGGSPALGITLVAAASLIGLVASVAAVAATPRSAG